MDVENDSVSQDCEERGEALNGMNEGDRYFRCRSRGEEMSADLESGKWESRLDDVAGGVTESMTKSRNCIFEIGKYGCEPGKGEAEEGDKSKLYERECCWLWKGVEDRL